MIQKRRNQESKLQNLYNLIKKDNTNIHRANWEKKSEKLMENTQIKSKYSMFREQQKKFLDMRRKKLADLLISEEEAYRQEIIAKQETPEQVRNKMEAKLIELKDQREQERQEQVKRLQEKRFYESADELRKNDSEAFAFACYLEQENQMLDKMKKREQERQEEEVFVKLSQYEIQKKKEKEEQELQAKKKREAETYKFLDWQKRTQDLNAMQEAENKRHEIEKLREQWEKDKILENEEKEKRKKVNKNVYKDIEEFNKREEAERQKRSEYEKKKDKELVENIVQKEKKLDELDKKEKEKKIKEFEQNKKYLEFVMKQKKETDAWMDNLAQVEADSQWQKTQESWMKDEAARIELLKKVYKDREEAVMMKKYVEENVKEEIKKEREELDQEIKNYKEACERIYQEEAARRKKHQDDLRYQMQEKERQRQKELQDKIYEERAAKLWEMEYQKKINDQRQLHLQKLEEIKRRGLE